ncbi:tetratricopeptide repeat protein [Nocardia sp. NPDC020380]|uniref:tetratricopeptide repeat protein n=1 Tax=Nocardia sp. NPDC020380 TaxID=3364309 RepID=UPI00378B464C
MSDALRKAAALLALQRYEAAYEAAAEVLAGDPHNVQALALAAHISLTALREYQRAFDLSTTALASEPDLDLLWRLRACDEQRWRADDPEAIARGEAQLRDELRDDPENVAVIRQLALLDWLHGRRRAAITRLRTIVKLDPDRGDEIAAQIAVIEAEEEKAAAAKAVRAAEAEAARERIAEQKAAVAARRARAHRAARAEQARATRVRRPKRSMAGTLFLLPFFLIARLLLHSCSTDSSGSEPHYTTPSPVVPVYQPWGGSLSGLPGIPAVPPR